MQREEMFESETDERPTTATSSHEEMLDQAVCIMTGQLHSNSLWPRALHPLRAFHKAQSSSSAESARQEEEGGLHGDGEQFDQEDTSQEANAAV
jgi:hypothetical protein